MDKPTIQQIQDYAEHLNYEIDAEKFFDYYETIGWVYGSAKNRKPIVDWKAAVRTWKRRDAKRQKAAQGEITGRVRQQPRYHEPTVFVQCVKGPTTGRYLPIMLKNGHLKDIPNEQYILAARDMCTKLNQTDGTEWVIRSDVTERDLMAERHKAFEAKADTGPKPNPKTPLQIKQELKKQIKKLEDDLKF